ncbi:hypothetical protein I1A62_44410 [Rhodococcus sp. USK10]|uniref:hypothetical protein n=1 Tax=Rhodococcus sp. USK10 TaxID=2789739 RepID=UPI001C5E5847|nr:hypothetical protein [Rhodococcus sp. USK10]QYB04058.1 hypothetical protein I1A62_44410 [Rhodococcus sp. USK10]
MTTSRTRLLAATSAVPLLALVIARLAWGDDLPPVVASHWSGTEPDGFSDTTTYFWIAVAVCAIAAGIAGVVAVRIRTDAALWLPATVFTGWTVATTWIASVAATVRTGAPEAATLGWWIVIPLLGIPWAFATFVLLPRPPRATENGPAPTLPVPLAPGERASWTGYARGRWAGVLALAMAVAAVVSALVGALWLAVLFLVLVVAGGTFASVTVQVDRTGLSLSSWNVRWRHIPLDAVDEAQVTEIRPGEWGGWGYRFSPRGTAVVIRGGEGIVVTRTGGRPFAVTVDGAAQGAALLNSLAAPSPTG